MNEFNASSTTTSISTPLQILYTINGATLSLPSLAVTALINDRVSIPVDLLSAYGALSFLPWSFKPIYGILLRNKVIGATLLKEENRHILLFLCYLMLSFCFMLTSIIPTNGIIVCFLLGFTRGVVSSFPEFILDLTLIEEAKNVEEESHRVLKKSKKELYNQVSGIFQAQAATNRNTGSLLASGTMFLTLLYLEFISAAKENNQDTQNSQLSNPIITSIFLVTSILPLSGAFTAFYFKLGSKSSINRGTYLEITSDKSGDYVENTSSPLFHDVVTNDDNLLSIPTSSNELETNSYKYELVGIVLFQSIIIWFGLKRPLQQVSTSLWNFGLLFIFILFLGILMKVLRKYNLQQQQQQNSVIYAGPALFLILRHALPQASYQWYSYSYYLFRTSPIYLQIFSLLNSTMSTLSSNSYAKYVAPQGRLILVFITTTLLSTGASFLYLKLTSKWDETPENHVQENFWIALPIGAISSFFYEMSFIPSVVLATNCVQLEEGNELEGVQYGTYVGCIDFGDQIGAWLTVPLVAALGISRNDWSHFSEFIFICGLCNILSLFFLFLIIPSLKKNK